MSADSLCPRSCCRAALRIAAVAVLAAGPVPVSAQRPARPSRAAVRVDPAKVDALLAGPTLQADVDLLSRAEETLHPGLYRYQTPAAWRARVATLRRDVAGGMSQREFYARLADLTAAIRCGHSYPNFFNQPPDVRARVLESAPRLPFLFRWAGDTMIVTRVLSPELLPEMRVLAIDGMPAARVLARLLPMARADGGNDAKRREVLSVTGRESYEAFDVYYPLRFTLGDTVTLDVLRPAAAPRRGRAPATFQRLRVATLSFGERGRAMRDGRAAAPPDTNPLGWTLALLAGGPGAGDSAAVLTMPSWGTYEHAGWNWHAWLDGALARVRASRASRLVIDLRDNEGGDDEVQRALLAAVARRPVTLVGDAQYVRYRTLPPALRPYADTWDRTFDDWTPALAPTAPPVRGPGGVELYRLRPGRMGADTTLVTPAASPLSARVAVLVGPVNSSSTYAFAQAVRRSGLAALVGAPTGGNQRGINGGGFYFFRLPGSGIEVDIPLVGYYPPETGPGARLADIPDAGLAPDVRAGRPAGARRGDSDDALDAALAHLRR